MAREFICEDCLWDSKAWNDVTATEAGAGICQRCNKTTIVKGFLRAKFADIQAPRPKPRPIPTDWATLKAEFIAQTEYKLVRPWLRDVKGFSEGKLVAGETIEETRGWGEERATERLQMLEEAKASAKEKLADMIPDLYLGKQKILEKLNAKLDQSLDIDEFIDILKVFKTELGEPTSVSKQQITASDEVDEALQELRDVVNSSREGKDAAGSTPDAPTSATEPDPIEVS